MSRPTPTSPCVDCGRGMVGRTAWENAPRGTVVRHEAHGLCRLCYERRRAGVPPRPVPPVATIQAVPTRSDELLDDYVMIRDDCRNIREAAARMGLTFTQLDKALYRARRRGDQRGLAPLRQRVRADLRGMPFKPVTHRGEAA